MVLLASYSRWLRLLAAQALQDIARDARAHASGIAFTAPQEGALRLTAPALFLFDDFALGCLQAVERAMGLMAGYGLQLWPILQDMSQLKDLYGARANTFVADPKLFAKPIGQAVREQLEVPLSRLKTLHAGFSDNSRQSLHRLSELATAKADLLHALQTETAKAQRWNKRIPFMAIGALVLVLAPVVILPRVFATNPTVCAILGGDAVGGSCMFFGEWGFWAVWGLIHRIVCVK